MSYIHSTAIVKTDRIGENVEIGPFCYITERVVIGDNVKIHTHVVLGTEAQALGQKDHGYDLVIGAGTTIREFTNANVPLRKKDSIIGENVFLMSTVHITHDVTIGDNSILCPGLAIGGHFTCGKRVYLSLNATTHQYAHMGAYCLLGAGSFFKGVSPRGLIWVGSPAKPLKVNMVGLNRYAMAKERAEIIIEAEEFLRNYNK